MLPPSTPHTDEVTNDARLRGQKDDNLSDFLGSPMRSRGNFLSFIS